MTVNDLLVAAPWILFGVALATVCLLLLSERGGPGGHPAFRALLRRRKGRR
jgi:peptidoglycan biosynthesis protein MviN/MurJ (putative lipid II flippase)